MASQIEHTPPPLATALPLSLLRAQVLAACTVSRERAVRVVSCSSAPGAVTRTIQWLELSYLMRKIEGGWRLTATGESALRATFVAACFEWPRCNACKRQKPHWEFLSAKNAPTKNCNECRCAVWQWKMDHA
jgi:hypothetical protein